MVFVSLIATHGLCRWRQSGLLDNAFMLLPPTWQSRSWVESFADDLNTRRGIVSGRVALLPQSIEIQPCVTSICASPLLILPVSIYHPPKAKRG
jgi:hypothetical protein